MPVSKDFLDFLNETFVIQRETRNIDEYNGYDPKWITLGNVKGRLSPQSGGTREIYEHDRLRGQIGLVLYLPYGTDIKARDRVIDRNKSYRVQTVREPGGEEHHLEVDLEDEQPILAKELHVEIIENNKITGNLNVPGVFIIDQSDITATLSNLTDLELGNIQTDADIVSDLSKELKLTSTLLERSQVIEPIISLLITLKFFTNTNTSEIEALLSKLFNITANISEVSKVVGNFFLESKLRSVLIANSNIEGTIKQDDRLTSRIFVSDEITSQLDRTRWVSSNINADGDIVAVLREIADLVSQLTSSSNVIANLIKDSEFNSSVQSTSNISGILEVGGQRILVVSVDCQSNISPYLAQDFSLSTNVEEDSDISPLLTVDYLFKGSIQENGNIAARLRNEFFINSTILEISNIEPTLRAIVELLSNVTTASDLTGEISSNVPLTADILSEDTIRGILDIGSRREFLATVSATSSIAADTIVSHTLQAEVIEQDNISGIIKQKVVINGSLVDLSNIFIIPNIIRGIFTTIPSSSDLTCLINLDKTVQTAVSDNDGIRGILTVGAEIPLLATLSDNTNLTSTISQTVSLKVNIEDRGTIAPVLSVEKIIIGYVEDTAQVSANLFVSIGRELIVSVITTANMSSRLENEVTIGTTIISNTDITGLLRTLVLMRTNLNETGTITGTVLQNVRFTSSVIENTNVQPGMNRRRSYASKISVTDNIIADLDVRKGLSSTVEDITLITGYLVAPLLIEYSETTTTDFNSGTLNDVEGFNNELVLQRTGYFEGFEIDKGQFVGDGVRDSLSYEGLWSSLFTGFNNTGDYSDIIFPNRIVVYSLYFRGGSSFYTRNYFINRNEDRESGPYLTWGNSINSDNPLEIHYIDTTGNVQTTNGFLIEDDWNLLEFTVDIPNQTYDFSLNGVTLITDINMTGGVENRGIDIDYQHSFVTVANSNITYYIDNWQDDWGYAPSGIRTKQIDISENGLAGSSEIIWSATAPTGTAATIETNVSLDGGNTFLGWKAAINSDTIPDIPLGTNLYDAVILIRETLTTSRLGGYTPSIQDLSFEINVIRYERVLSTLTATSENQFTMTLDKGINSTIADNSLITSTMIVDQALYTDFSEYTVGQIPNDWTPRWYTSEVTWETFNYGSGATGSQTMRYSATTNQFHQCSWNILDNIQDAEVTIRLRSTSTSVTPFGILLRASGTNASKSGYLLDLNGGNRERLVKWVNNSLSVITETTFNFSANTWYWLKFRLEGNQLSAKVWQDGNAEPVGWDITATDSDVPIGSGNYNGVFAYTANITTDFDIYDVTDLTN